MTDPQIVCGVDGSPCSVHAAAVAATLADEMRGRVVLVHVLPFRPSMPLAAVPVGAHPVTSSAMRELDRRESEAAFAAAEGELDGLPVDCVVAKGSPPARIAVVALARCHPHRRRYPIARAGRRRAPRLGPARARRSRAPACRRCLGD